MHLIKQFSGNCRAKTEIGRELQDADLTSTPSWEDDRGVFLSGKSLHWYRLSNIGQKYEVEFDRNHGGFNVPTDCVGTYDSLGEAVKAVYNHT